MSEINGFRNIKKKTVTKRIYNPDESLNKSFIYSISQFGESRMLIEQTDYKENGEIEFHMKDDEEEYFRKRKELSIKDDDDSLFNWDGKKEEIVEDPVFGKTKLNYEYDGSRIKAMNKEYLEGKILGRERPKLKGSVDREEYGYDDKGRPTLIKKISSNGNVKTTQMVWDENTGKMQSRSVEENNKLTNLEEFYYDENGYKERRTTTRYEDDRIYKYEVIYNSEQNIIERLNYDNNILVERTVNEYYQNLEMCPSKDLFYKYVNNNLILNEELIYEYEFHKFPLKKFD